MLNRRPAPDPANSVVALRPLSNRTRLHLSSSPSPPAIEPNDAIIVMLHAGRVL